MLADSLNTQQNYVLDASPVALRLGSNEYVTEVMFVFGVVPSNFRQVETPIIDCSGCPGSKAAPPVNQANVGGVYDGQWIMATPRWVTKVYAPLSKPLPRTGLLVYLWRPAIAGCYTHSHILKPFAFSQYDIGREKELFQMFKREKKAYLEPTDAERRLADVSDGLAEQADRPGWDAGPVNDLLIK